MSRVCCRCAESSTARMGYDYSSREVWIDNLSAEEPGGVTYLLCETHAARLTPPQGWVLFDLRTPVLELFSSVDVA